MSPNSVSSAARATSSTAGRCPACGPPSRGDISLPVIVSPTGVSAVESDGEVAAASWERRRPCPSFAGKPVEEVIVANPRSSPRRTGSAVGRGLRILGLSLEAIVRPQWLRRSASRRVRRSCEPATRAEGQDIGWLRELRGGHSGSRARCASTMAKTSVNANISVISVSSDGGNNAIIWTASGRPAMPCPGRRGRGRPGRGVTGRRHPARRRRHRASAPGARDDDRAGPSVGPARPVGPALRTSSTFCPGVAARYRWARKLPRCPTSARTTSWRRPVSPGPRYVFAREDLVPRR